MTTLLSHSGRPPSPASLLFPASFGSPASSLSAASLLSPASPALSGGPLVVAPPQASMQEKVARKRNGRTGARQAKGMRGHYHRAALFTTPPRGAKPSLVARRSGLHQRRELIRANQAVPTPTDSSEPGARAHDRRRRIHVPCGRLAQFSDVSATHRTNRRSSPHRHDTRASRVSYDSRGGAQSAPNAPHGAARPTPCSTCRAMRRAVRRHGA